MPTINAPEFDYQTYAKEHPPDPSKLQRGSSARHQRRETAKGRITIWIDHEVLEQFKQLVPDGQGYQSLINQALREWLAARLRSSPVAFSSAARHTSAISFAQAHRLFR